MLAIYSKLPVSDSSASSGVICFRSALWVCLAFDLETMTDQMGIVEYFGSNGGGKCGYCKASKPDPSDNGKFHSGMFDPQKVAFSPLEKLLMLYEISFNGMLLGVS